ncbi:hypothetical protein ANN_06282 [Periplaneta americana]|uniref:Uncharacterized protein n=1 Tax=Periplaneta americana TaxID=6978 RepID=A0ABQ8TD56_PERAM|nr:hypothetical protein ANN_06282 [Periplaneta americana]
MAGLCEGGNEPPGSSKAKLLENIPVNIRERIWFQHDGAPPHFDRRVRNHLNATFPDRWIGGGGPVPWPPRSPNLTPLDFFCG